jgi:hypothetical protein
VEVQVPYAEVEAKMDSTLAALALRLQMFANQANGRWINTCRVESPFVYHPTTSRTLRSDYRLRLPHLTEMLTAGQLVLQFIESGEDVVGLDERTGELTRVALAHCDLWQPIGQFFPHRLPIGDRVEGISVIGRMLLAALEGVIITAGPGALLKLKVCTPSCDTLG